MNTSSPQPRHRIEPLESRIAPAVFLVTNHNDSGTGSLRQAVLNANADTHPGPKIIEFTPSVLSPITLTSGQIVIDTALTILGPGPSKVIIDGDGSSRIFDIPNTGSLHTVTIEGVSLVNGDTSGRGGAIDANESLTLVKTFVTGNTATGSGGGIYDDVGPGGIVRIVDSTITNNHSGVEGGGLYAHAGRAIQITQTAFVGNSAATEGGAIFTFEGTNASISDTVINANTAGGSGGGVQWRDGVLHISGSEISNNYSGSVGGGVYIASGKVTIVSSAIEANQAHTTGGGIGDVGNSSGTLTIIGASISNNVATTAGGGIYTKASETVIVSSRINENLATTTGGGIADFGPMTIVGSNISGNLANEATDASGGGIYSTGSHTVQIITSLVAGNTAASAGAGVAVIGGTQLDVISSNISGNSTTKLASPGEGGGGIFAKASGNVKIIGSNLSGNYSYDQGGGLYFGNNNSASLLIVGSKITHNSADDLGSGIEIDASGATTILNSFISGNSSAGLASGARSGGGIYINGNTGETVTIHGGAITDNHASKDGGGVYIKGNSGGSVTISHVLITENTAVNSGGGIYDESSSVILTVPGSVIKGNFAPTDPDSNLI